MDREKLEFRYFFNAGLDRVTCECDLEGSGITGMCMGRNTTPALGMVWNAMGTTMHRAAHTAVNTRFLT